MMVKFLVNGSPDIKRISVVHVNRLEFTDVHRKSAAVCQPADEGPQ